MVSLATITIVIVGMIIGLLLGLTGGGGSILTVPLLVYVVGLDAKIAIATSLLVVGLASLAALLPHSRAGNVYWRTGIIFGLAGMAGAYSGGRIAQFIADALLLLLFAAVMIGSGVAMLRRRSNGRQQPVDGAAADGQPRSMPKVIADGFIVGIVTGLVGAGGGFLVVPALALLGGLPMHAAVGTSLLVITMKCFAGLAGYISHVPIDVESATIVSALAIIGTVLGSRLSRLVSGSQLQRGFGGFVLVIAAILIVIEGSSLLAAALGYSRAVVAAVLAASECLIVVVTVARLRTAATRASAPG